MSSFIVDHTHEGTLDATAEDEIEFRFGSTVTIQNITGDALMRVTVDGAEPTEGGETSYVVATSSFRQLALTGLARTVRVVGDGNFYTVDTEPV